MNVGESIERAARVVWGHKSLILLGVVIAILTGSAGGSSFLLNLIVGRRLGAQLPTIPGVERFLSPRSLFPEQPIRALAGAVSRFGIAGWVGLIIALLLILIALGVIVLVARGGLIAAVDEIERTGTSSLRSALRTGWQRAWRLIVIASIPAIPVTLAAILIVIVATLAIQAAGGIEVINGPAAFRRQLGGGLLLASTAILCHFALLTFALGLLRHLADRACVVENAGVIASYRRGWDVLRANAGPAVLLLLFQLGIGIVVSSVLTLPRVLASTCILFIPFLWLIGGVLKAYFVALWTLAWRAWTPDAASSPS